MPFDFAQVSVRRACPERSRRVKHGWIQLKMLILSALSLLKFAIFRGHYNSIDKLYLTYRNIFILVYVHGLGL